MSQGEREGPLQVDNHRICGLCREPVTAREESAGKREWSVQRLKTTKRVDLEQTEDSRGHGGRGRWFGAAVSR